MKRIVAILGIIIALMTIFAMSSYADEEVVSDVTPDNTEAASTEVPAEEPNDDTSILMNENQEVETHDAEPIHLKEIGIYSAIVVLIFLVALVYVLGLSSIRIVLSNIISGLIVWVFFTKGLMWGWNKIFIIFSTIWLLIIFNLVILKGVNKKSLIALIGCSFSALFIGLISLVFVMIAKKFGIGNEALSLNNFWIFDFNYIYLSIIITIVSSLGVCLEIGYSISNNLFENKNTYEDMKLLDLIKESKKYARTIVSSKLNMLLFNLLCIMNIIFIFVKITSIIKINEYEIYAQMTTLFVCETLGILFTILCTAFAFWILYSKRTEYRKKSANIVEGKRSLKI